MMRLDSETGYLRELARAWAHGAASTVPAPRDLDGERFLYLFSGQPALPTLRPYLDPSALSPAALDRLDLAVEVARRRTTVLLLELERLLPALAERRCRPVVLKGASLALMVYARPEDRWFIDLDLLVERDDLDAVYAALERLGYRFADTVYPARYYEAHHFHRILVSQQGVCVEVHWAVTMPASVYTYDLEALRRDSVEIPLGAADFLAPGALDQILHGVLQSIAGGFGDLRRVLDLHLLDARLDADERRLLSARALNGNLATGLWLQYRLREQFFDLPIPAEVEAVCRPGPGLVRVLERLEIAAACLDRPSVRGQEHSQLLHWLCTPAGRRSGEVRRYLFPDQKGLIEGGFAWGARVDPWRRGRLQLERLLQTARMLGRLTRAAV
jgi:hypothetical protein